MSAKPPFTAIDVAVGTITDAELVDRFVANRDPAAFGELVFRHRALVLGVCSRVLTNTSDIEDVFQATFLVFVRDAARVRRQQSIASWLYGVAHRLALRVARHCRRKRETVLVELAISETDVLSEVASRHDQQLLDTELNGLPEQYRVPLVLRYLAGKPPREIAQELSITAGALDGLLKRAKEELRVRLMRRGVTLGVTLVAIQLSQQAATAADTLPLVNLTAQAGLAWQNGFSAAPDFTSQFALDLAAKELATMTTLTKTCLAMFATAGLTVAWIGASHAVGQPQDSYDGTSIKSEAGVPAQSSINRGQTAAPLVIAQGPQLSKSAAKTTDAARSGERAEPAQNITDPIRSPTNARDQFSQREPASTEKAAVKAWDRKSRSPLTKNIEVALQRPTEVSFTDNPLEEALNYLEDLHHIEIWLDRPALQEAGVATDQQVTLVMTGTSLESTLAMILEPLQLDYVIKNEVLTITTAQKCKLHFETRVYDVARLKGVTPSELTQVICSTIAPHTWTPEPDSSAVRVKDPGEAKPAAAGAAGGRNDLLAVEGSIRATKTSLVIRQTQRVHDEIVDLLNQLEEVSPAAGATTEPKQATEPTKV